MRFRILALDYDGTIAEHGVLAPEAQAAIAEARARGIVVIVVTGRTVDDVRGALGQELALFDAVVAENGAVVVFPASGRRTVLGQAPPPAFLERLRQDRVPFALGACVVELDAAHAERVLTAIEELELPLALLFNRRRLMVLPQGVSKATGLSMAAQAMRLSLHNAIGIGDAENDHALLAACELGVAVGWGSPALQGAADLVLVGSGPASVAQYIRSVIAQPRLAPDQAGRRDLLLGHDAESQAVTVGVRGQNLLVAGDPRSGKSWITGLLAEQLIVQGYCICLVDPEGDYRPLESLQGVDVLGGDAPPPRPHDVARALRHPDRSLVIDLSGLPHDAKRDYVDALLHVLVVLRRQTGLPHRIVIDEAHYFLADHPTEVLDLDLAGYILATYRLSQLPPTVIDASDAVILTRMTDRHELTTILEHRDTSSGPDMRTALGSLSVGEAVVLPPGDEQPLRKFRLAPRLTQHVRHRQKYVDVPVAFSHGFTFTRDGVPMGQPVRTLRELVVALEDCPLGVLRGHLARADISSWVGEVFGDATLAARLREVEGLDAVRGVVDARDAIRELVEERYAFCPDHEGAC